MWCREMLPKHSVPGILLEMRQLMCNFLIQRKPSSSSVGECRATDPRPAALQSKATKPALPSAPRSFPASSYSPHHFQRLSTCLVLHTPGTGSFSPSHPWLSAVREPGGAAAPELRGMLGAVQPAGWPSSTGGCWARTVLAEPPSSFHTLLFVACRELASAGAEPSGKFTLSSPTGLIHWRVSRRQTGSGTVAKTY